MTSLYIMSNVNIDILEQILSKSFNVSVTQGYGGWISEIVNGSSNLYRNEYEDIFVCIELNDVIKNVNNEIKAMEEFDQCLKYLDQLSTRKDNSRIWVTTADILTRRCNTIRNNLMERRLEQYWNMKLLDMQCDHENVYVIDIKELVENLGREKFYYQKTWYAGGIPYSIKAIKEIAGKLENSISRFHEAELKCLAVDFDGVLWGGVIGEDGLDGIKLAEYGEGEIYRNLQLQIKRLVCQGVVLIGLTKNNEADVDIAFSHPNMVLKKSDFVVIRADWNEKWQNLKECIKQLNIGFNSVAFLDDNPVERDKMRNKMSDICIIDFPDEIYELEKNFILFCNKYFNKISLTEEDLTKTQMYKAEGERIKVKKTTQSFEDYINSLNIEIDFHLMQHNELDRAEQLFKKTNQFNLTGKRYTAVELKKMMHEGREIYLSHVKDKYGDYGIVSAVAVLIKDDRAEIENFVMSCRVMGRNVEFRILDELIAELKDKGVRRICGKYIGTTKNKPTEHFLDKYGFCMNVINNDNCMRSGEYII